MGQVHGVKTSTTVGVEDAEQIARVMSALGTASRVCILARLRQGSCSVAELTETVGMAQAAISHQLRVLRDLGFVNGVREGRNVIYQLHDSHVATLVDEALRHLEHLRATAGPNDSSRPIEGETMTTEHAHEQSHDHEHSHGQDVHEHAHSDHEHAHTEHTHEHTHDGTAHSHEHVHQSGLENDHEHAHA